MGIEPMASSLPRKRSTPELHRLTPLILERKKGGLTHINPPFGFFERETRFELATLSLEG